MDFQNNLSYNRANIILEGGITSNRIAKFNSFDWEKINCNFKNRRKVSEIKEWLTEKERLLCVNPFSVELKELLTRVTKKQRKSFVNLIIGNPDIKVFKLVYKKYHMYMETPEIMKKIEKMNSEAFLYISRKKKLKML
jgi:hypothetical protein